MFVEDSSKDAKANKRKAMAYTEMKSIALVNLKRSIESKKAERLQKNLHMIDFDRNSNHIRYVDDVKDIKGSVSM